MIKIWRDKSGKWITPKEFVDRFKEGVNNLTPIQKLQNEANGTLTSLIGFIVSIIAVIYNIKTIGLLSIGLILIFTGSIWTTGLKWIVTKQQIKFLKDLTKQLEVKEDGTTPTQ